MNFHVNPLDDIRTKLASIDKNIAKCLRHFRAAKNPDIFPTTDMVARVKFSQEIENLSLEQNTPIELFAGVALFLALKVSKEGVECSRRMDSGADKKKEFIELCKELCERHKQSRLVYEHKKLNRPQFEDKTGKVITFIPEQHDRVVSRMSDYSMWELSSDYNLSANIINWVAAVNAGWQDMGINERKGPFVTPVTETSRFEIRDPRPSKMA